MLKLPSKSLWIVLSVNITLIHFSTLKLLIQFRWTTDIEISSLFIIITMSKINKDTVHDSGKRLLIFTLKLDPSLLCSWSNVLIGWCMFPPLQRLDCVRTMYFERTHTEWTARGLWGVIHFIWQKVYWIIMVNLTFNVSFLSWLGHTMLHLIAIFSPVDFSGNRSNLWYFAPDGLNLKYDMEFFIEMTCTSTQNLSGISKECLPILCTLSRGNVCHAG